MKGLEDFEMSDLEQEVELEMDDSAEVAEVDEETDEDQESAEDKDLERAFEDLEEPEPESREYEDIEGEIDEEAPDDYGQRFYEFSTRTFENESDLDREIGEVLDGMDRQYFSWSKLKDRIKGAGKGLAKRALKLAPGLSAFQAIKSFIANPKEFLKTQLLPSLIKAGLGSAIPGGSALLPALKAFGFESTEDHESNREGWENAARVARESFEYLPDYLNERSDDPLEARRQATAAFQRALRNVQNRVAAGRTGAVGGHPVLPQPSSRRRKVLRIRVRPGEVKTIRLRVEGVSR